MPTLSRRTATNDTSVMQDSHNNQVPHKTEELWPTRSAAVMCVAELTVNTSVVITKLPITTFVTTDYGNAETYLLMCKTKLLLQLCNAVGADAQTVSQLTVYNTFHIHPVYTHRTHTRSVHTVCHTSLIQSLGNLRLIWITFCYSRTAGFFSLKCCAYIIPHFT